MALEYFAGDAETYRELGLMEQITRLGGIPRYERGDTDSPAYLDESIAFSHDRWWWLLRALLGGTHGMRLNYASTLPRLRGEVDQQYVWRLKRSFLDPYFSNAVDKMTAKAFSRPIAWKGKVVPEPLKEFAGDVDGRGTDATAFAQSLFCDALAFGLTHVLIDASDKPVMSAADEDGIEVRLAQIKASDVLGYGSAMIGRSQTLVSLRFHRTMEGVVGRFGRATIHEIVFMERLRSNEIQPVDAGVIADAVDDGEYSNTIRVTRFRWEINKSHGNAWEWVELEPTEFRYDGPGLPIVTIYASAKSGFMVAEPPMWSLAEVNLQQWQFGSDLGSIVHHTMLPVPVLTGFTDDEAPDPYAHPGKPVVAKNPQATANYMEISGAAAEVGSKYLDRIEQTAERLGGQSSARVDNETATSQRMRENRATTEALRTVGAVEVGLRAAIVTALGLVDVEVPDDVAPEINRDFESGHKDPSTATTLESNSDVISRQTRFDALKRLGIGIPEELTWDEERERIRRERQQDIEDLPELQDLGGPPQQRQRQQQPQNTEDEDTGDQA